MPILGEKDEWIDISKTLIAVMISLMTLVSVASWLITGTVYFQLLGLVVGAIVIGVIGCIITLLVYRLLFGKNMF